jgi:hypothetical protein
MRQQLDVVALKLAEVEEGQLLTIWVAVAGIMIEVDGGGEDEDFDEDFDEDDDDAIPF